MRTVIFIPIAKFTRLLALLSLIFSTLSVFAASTISFDCPATVTATSANVAEVDASWQILNYSNKLNVISAGIFEGSPADRAELKPYESRKKHSLTQVKWKFEGTAPGGRWVLCSYEGQLFSLTKKLPDNVKECVVVYKKIDTKSQQLSSIVCK